MKKVIFLLLCICVCFFSCTSKEQSKKAVQNVQGKESLEVTGSNQTVVVSDDAKSITVTGNNNTVSTENAAGNTNN